MQHCVNNPNNDECWKMVAGHPFWPYAPVLVANRDQCSIMLHALNATSQNGCDDAAKEILFRTLTMIGPSTRHVYLSRMKAQLGQNIHVRLPFRCDYGYNLRVGNNVTLGSHCWLHDAAMITIKDNVQICHDVRFDCVSYSHDPKDRRGAQKLAVARPIVIEENVYIGAGTIVLGGVHIGRNCYIWPNSVISDVRYQWFRQILSCAEILSEPSPEHGDQRQSVLLQTHSIKVRSFPEQISQSRNHALSAINTRGMRHIDPGETLRNSCWG